MENGKLFTVKIKNLTKKFGSSVAPVIAIDNLSLNIEKGKITGLIGADGAGKTTLLRTIIGLLLPNEGEINVLGFNPVTEKDKLLEGYTKDGKIHLPLGYMPQKFGLYEDLTVIENLRLYADLKGVAHDFDKMLEFTTLAPFQDRLAGALSGGMKQKLGLACTLLGNPEFLLLDEPSVGVDPISRRDLMKMVREMINPETTVLWSTAYLDEAHSFDTAVVLDKGKVIYEGKPHDLAPIPQEFENKVIGSGTVLDTARLKYELGNHLNVDSRSVHAFIIGEHGDSEIAAWSSANVSGIPLNKFCEMRGHFNHDEAMKRIAENVKNSAYEIIEKKKATYYGVAMAVKRICEAIVRDEKSILPISSLMKGDFGIEGISLSMPAIVGKDGVECLVPIQLNEEEISKLQQSAQTLKNTLSQNEV